MSSAQEEEGGWQELVEPLAQCSLPWAVAAPQAREHSLARGPLGRHCLWPAAPASCLQLSVV